MIEKDFVWNKGDHRYFLYELGILCCFPLEKYLFSAVSVQIHAGSYKTKMVDRFMK